MVFSLYLHIARGEWKLSLCGTRSQCGGGPPVRPLGRNSGHMAIPFMIGLFYLAAFYGRICSAVFSNRVIINIAGMCYFYVYYVLQATLILPVVLLLCFTFFLIERPSMDRK